MAMMGADTLVQVQAVNASGVEPTGTVDVLPLVMQQDGNGTPTPQPVIHNVPYLRIQGGTSAVICDPVVGDIGGIIICGRDISRVKSTKKQSPPGSFRMHDMADAVYVGGFLNTAPQQYVQFTDQGITIVTPNKLTIQASEVDITGPVKVAGSITATGDVQGNGISLDNHIHGGVQSGESTTGNPE